MELRKDLLQIARPAMRRRINTIAIIIVILVIVIVVMIMIILLVIIQ